MKVAGTCRTGRRHDSAASIIEHTHCRTNRFEINSLLSETFSMQYGARLRTVLFAHKQKVINLLRYCHFRCHIITGLKRVKNANTDTQY